jgi:uncharacterized protein YutE (UPF0331/DUF86 family)
MDWPVIEQKLESLQRCLRRVLEKCPPDVNALTKDVDAQDILTLNLTRSVQLCVDIGAYLIAATQLPPPDTMGQTFDILMEAHIIEADLAARMKRAVGFRNLAIHNYDVINWTIVYAIAQHHLIDFEDFAKAVVTAWSRSTRRQE